MNRSKSFIATTTGIMCVITALFFYSGRAANGDQPGSREMEEQMQLLRESAMLDSLYKDFRDATAGTDRARLVASELKLKNQIAGMKAESDSALLTSSLASHLVRSYERRIHTIATMIRTEHSSAGQVQILKQRITALEKSNEDIRVENQLIKQAILNQSIR